MQDDGKSDLYFENIQWVILFNSKAFEKCFIIIKQSFVFVSIYIYWKFYLQIK